MMKLYLIIIIIIAIPKYYLFLHAKLYCEISIKISLLLNSFFKLIKYVDKWSNRIRCMRLQWLSFICISYKNRCDDKKNITWPFGYSLSINIIDSGNFNTTLLYSTKKHVNQHNIIKVGFFVLVQVNTSWLNS